MSNADDQDPEDHEAANPPTDNPAPMPQPARIISRNDQEARKFALRYLSRALTTLERGILRLEHLGQYIDAFGLRTVWVRLLTDFVKRGDTVAYEPARTDIKEGADDGRILNEALDDFGMALVLAEATMARWEWVPHIASLREEVVLLYERFGRRLP